ncbi:MAG: regulatory protein RecX [Chloroflexi bacterium]|nr:regulatory protein RecX [Chloroflexota bacterium]
MPTVTALIPQPRRRGRLTLFLDGTVAFQLHRILAREVGLFIGQELTPEGVQALQEREAFLSALDTAYRFLASRPRSEAEVRLRLRRGKIPGELADRVVERLKEQRLLDDEAFARQWAEQRAVASPRSRSLVRWELRQKGIGLEQAQQAVEELDDAEAAYQAGFRRGSRFKAGDYQAFRQVLWDFLRRRGFGYGVIAATIERLWRERSEVATDPAF